jgi:transposase
MHGLDEEERVVVRRTLRRSSRVLTFFGAQACLIGMGSVCLGLHYWGRELMRLRAMLCG